GELLLVTAMLEAVAADDSHEVEARSATLRRLDEQTDGEDLLPQSWERPAGGITPVPVDEAGETEETAGPEQVATTEPAGVEAGEDDADAPVAGDETAAGDET